MRTCGLLGLLAMALVFGPVGAARAQETTAAWDAVGAARYLDGRLSWWREWPKAKRDHGTSCISCHTALPVALARPVLRKTLRDRTTPMVEQAMYADVVKRVRMWRDVEPFYSDQRSGLPKTSESRAVEAVLNALFLVTRDNESGAGLSDDTRQAFANMWPLQMERGPLDGGFAWLTFNLEPWESETASYWGASLAAIAVAEAPGDYAAAPEIAENLSALRDFLRTGLRGESSLFTRILVLWADSHLHGVAGSAERQRIVDQLLTAQSADGGWSLTRLSAWRRRDGSTLPESSDGFATAMATLVLRDAGVSQDTPPMLAARRWLITHQDAVTGALPATSINRQREPSADAYLFMTDAATGFATLALADAPTPGR